VFTVGRLYHFTLVVDDLDAADRWYSTVFGARRIYRGRHAGAMRNASMLVIGDAVIELIEVDRSHEAAETPLGRFHARFGQRMHSIAMFVDSLGDAGETLHAAGVRMTDTLGRPISDVRPDRTIWTHPRDTIVMFEFAVVPPFHFDPRLHPSWSDAYWRSGPLGILAISHATVLVADHDHGRRVFDDALKRDLIVRDTSSGGGRLVYDLGPDLRVELLTPGPADSLEQRQLRLLGDGPFGYCLEVADLTAVERHLAAHGQPVTRRGSNELTIEPQYAHGTAVSFIEV